MLSYISLKKSHPLVFIFKPSPRGYLSFNMFRYVAYVIVMFTNASSAFVLMTQIFVLPVTGHASYHGPTTLSVTGVFLSLDLVCGTVCLQTYDFRCNSGHSDDNSKQYCLVGRDNSAQ